MSAIGAIKKIKSDIVMTEAKRAIEENRSIFTPKLNEPKTQKNISGSVSGWAEIIESIESVGWTLIHWSVSEDGKGTAIAYPLFRREVKTSSPPPPPPS